MSKNDGELAKKKKIRTQPISMQQLQGKSIAFSRQMICTYKSFKNPHYRSSLLVNQLCVVATVVRKIHMKT